MESKKTKSSGLIAPGFLLPFILVTSLFFLWGIPNNLNDVLIKQFMKSFELSRFEAGLIQSAFYMGYFVLAMPAALVMKKYGYKTGMVIGLLLYGIGCFLFWPAASIGRYDFFLFALFVIASGLAFLETGANPFITVLGNPATSERRLNFSQAFNPIGSIAGVLIGTFFIFSGIEHDETRIATMKLAGEYEAYLHQETMRVVTPYIILAGITLVMAILIIKTKFPEISEGSHSDDGKKGGRFKDLIRYPHFVKGVIAQFFYVGAQVGTWSYFIQYVQDYTGQNEKVAGYFLTGTLLAFMIGRFSATVIMRYVKPGKLMGIYGLANICLVGIGILFPGWFGLWAIFCTSFFMSLMFPTIFAMGLKGLGPNTKMGGSMIVMAIIGGAFWTPVMGLISEATHSMALAMIIPLLAYIFIAWYAFFGSEPSGNLYLSGEETLDPVH
jgi:FHS family L-fucose permease-like MFS transporter